VIPCESDRIVIVETQQVSVRPGKAPEVRLRYVGQQFRRGMRSCSLTGPHALSCGPAQVTGGDEGSPAVQRLLRSSNNSSPASCSANELIEMLSAWNECG